jgi:hypothetical protein
MFDPFGASALSPGNNFAFVTNVSADLVFKMIEQQKRKKTCHSSVSVCKGVDATEVKRGQVSPFMALIV